MINLNSENYLKGFLVDEELMAGITPHREQPGVFIAFVLKHTTGEYLSYQPFSDLESALQTMNQIQRPWSFESLSGCGGGGCNSQGTCSKGSSCHQK